MGTSEDPNLATSGDFSWPQTTAGHHLAAPAQSLRSTTMTPARRIAPGALALLTLKAGSVGAFLA